MTASALLAEFDEVAGWTAEAVERLGDAYAIPAACRGSADPAALAWLAEACELAAGTRLLDVGAGVGGPAAWAARRFGARPILLEPMPGAGRAASRLFGLPVLTGDGARIPLRTASVDAAWCLGVLDTVRDEAAVLREIHRVLRPGASLGLLVVVAQGRQLLPAPDGNHFPTRRALADLLDRTGFAPVEQIDRPVVPPLSWTRRAERVAEAVASRHRTDRAHVLAARQSERFTRLFDAVQIAVRLVHAVRRDAPDRRPATRTVPGGEMSRMTGDEEFEVEVEAELSLAESSDPGRAAALPVEEWTFDPADAQREEIGLRNLLGALDGESGENRP